MFPYLIFRIPTISADNSGQLQPRGSDPSDDGKDSCSRHSGSLDAMTNCGIVGGNELDNVLDGNRQDGLQILTETSRGCVNNNDSPPINTEQEETVYTRANTASESQLRSVHNRDGLNLKNLFAEGDEFD